MIRGALHRCEYERGIARQRTHESHIRFVESNSTESTKVTTIYQALTLCTSSRSKGNYQAAYRYYGVRLLKQKLQAMPWGDYVSVALCSYRGRVPACNVITSNLQYSSNNLVCATYSSPHQSVESCHTTTLTTRR